MPCLDSIHDPFASEANPWTAGVRYLNRFYTNFNCIQCCCWKWQYSQYHFKLKGFDYFNINLTKVLWTLGWVLLQNKGFVTCFIQDCIHVEVQVCTFNWLFFKFYFCSFPKLQKPNEPFVVLKSLLWKQRSPTQVQLLSLWNNLQYKYLVTGVTWNSQRTFRYCQKHWTTKSEYCHWNIAIWNQRLSLSVGLQGKIILPWGS